MKKIQFFNISMLSFVLLISFTQEAISQKKGGEKKSKDFIWEAQIISLGESYNLSKKDISRLSESYVNMRKEVSEQQKALAKNSNPSSTTKESENLEKEGKESIKKEIDKVLKDEQADEAVLLLGSFNSRWDSYQKALFELNLDQEQLSLASKALADYMKLYLKARKIAADSGERFSGRTATELKTKLDNSLSPHLNSSQLADWQTATQRKAKGK